MTIGGIIGLMLLTIVLGKRSKRLGVFQYVVIALITLAQVCIVLYDVFTIKPPVVP